GRLLPSILGKHFLKPNDVGPQEPITLRAARQLAQFFQATILKHMTCGTARPANTSVQLNNALASCPPVQAVDILRDQREAPVRKVRSFQLSQGEVAGIWLHGGQLLAPLIVEAPNESWIPAKSARRGHFFDAMAFPQSAGPAKRRHSTLGRNSRAGQRGHALG